MTGIQTISVPDFIKLHDIDGDPYGVNHYLRVLNGKTLYMQLRHLTTPQARLNEYVKMTGGDTATTDADELLSILTAVMQEILIEQAAGVDAAFAAGRIGSDLHSKILHSIHEHASVAGITLDGKATA